MLAEAHREISLSTAVLMCSLHLLCTRAQQLADVRENDAYKYAPRRRLLQVRVDAIGRRAASVALIGCRLAGAR